MRAEVVDRTEATGKKGAGERVKREREGGERRIRESLCVPVYNGGMKAEDEKAGGQMALSDNEKLRR
ncbi:hypothetical protein WN55_05094 [Dufourea novaeangliae]|uniref:Uncharacterized protein n=1 Tax=Dufourea novaeangliae TaxID=178035 RepID=A0A154PNV9_DUFNO|nr:hypothetical protein WN55_05094 [Dufourea novaeangliae]